MHCQTCQTAEDVFRIVRDKEISFIQIWFTDILGVLKSFSIRPSELEEAMTEGMGFDGSSIEGFARIEESDMIAKPDPTAGCFCTSAGGPRAMSCPKFSTAMRSQRFMTSGT